MEERYHLEQELGTGRAGAVFAAFDKELKRQVAFRRFHTTADNFHDEGWRNQFFYVVSELSRINHSNILSVLDAGIDTTGPYLVTAHVEGVRLSQLLKTSSQMQIIELYSLTCQCLDALQAAEEFGFYHHALCPSSIIATPKLSGGYHYTMMDLGHSKLIPLVSAEKEFGLSKTLDPALMAPELYEGKPEGIKSTLYMLGQLLYWMAAGGHPLAGHSLGLAHAKHKAGEIPYLKSYRADFPEPFRQWIYWLIQPESEKRPKSVMQAINNLPSQEAATTQPTMPKPTPMDSRVLKPDYES